MGWQFVEIGEWTMISSSSQGQKTFGETCGFDFCILSLSLAFALANRFRNVPKILEYVALTSIVSKRYGLGRILGRCGRLRRYGGALLSGLGVSQGSLLK